MIRKIGHITADKDALKDKDFIKAVNDTADLAYNKPVRGEYKPSTPEELAKAIIDYPNLWGMYSIADAIHGLMNSHTPDSKTLEACKDEVARKYDFDNFEDYKKFLGIYGWTEKMVNDIAELYSLSRNKEEWVSCEDRLPDLIAGKDYSENVFAIERGELRVMALVYINEDDQTAGYIWANCYGDINGDAEMDDDYQVTHWQPLPIPPKS